MVADARVAAADGFEDEKGFQTLPAVQGLSCNLQASPASTETVREFFSVASDQLA